MQATQEFKPDWFSPPGATIKQLLAEHGFTKRDFSSQLNVSEEFAESLLAGRSALTRDIAQELTTIFGGSQNFWLTRERQYREDLDRFKEAEKIEWIGKLPYADMAKLGWVKASRKVEEKIAYCMSFFGISSIDEWRADYENRLASTAFKASRTFESKAESLAAWLRQGELLSQNMSCANWDAKKFLNILPQAKALTRVKNPKEFLPVLEKLFSQCGVALIILPTPSGCPVSGAVFSVDNHATILLSVRYKTDDHFWFTLFHEAGHLLLHGDRNLIIEGPDSILEKDEQEANDFAKNLLIPPEFQAELRELRSQDLRKILKFAKKVGVSAGIVVGQLQHLKLIRHDYLNRLKAKFTLEDGLASSSE